MFLKVPLKYSCSPVLCRRLMIQVPFKPWLNAQSLSTEQQLGPGVNTGGQKLQEKGLATLPEMLMAQDKCNRHSQHTTVHKTLPYPHDICFTSKLLNKAIF